MGKHKRLPEKQSKLVEDFEPKNKKQQEFIDLIKENEIVIAKGIAGSGKSFVTLATALNLLGDVYKKIILVKSVVTIPGEEIGYIKGPQPLYSKISTPLGWKEMGDLKEGDVIHAYDGTNTTITEISERTIEDVYKITLSDRRTVLASITHGWLVTETFNNIKQSKIVSTKYLIEHPDHKFYLPLHKAVNYSSYNLPLDPYILGVLLGDGAISGSHIRFASIDEEIINRVTNSVNELGLEVIKSSDKNCLYTISNGKNNTQKGARILARKHLKTLEIEVLGALKQANFKFGYPTSKTLLLNRCTKNSVVDNWQYFFTGETTKASNEIRNSLEQLDLIGKKAWEKSIPAIYKYSSIEDRIELLRGLMDTDGTIKPDGSDIVYHTTSKILAEDIKELVSSLGGLATIYERNKIGQSNIVNGAEVINRRLNYEVYLKFFDSLINPFFLERKAKRFIPKSTDKYSTKIESIELVGKDTVQCITIDHPSHLYITDDFIVTHNSTHDKMAPYMMSYTWNIDKILGFNAAEELIEKGLIQVIPLAFFRGLSIDSAIVIVDESQNLSTDIFKTIITRIGENCKYIFLGDTEQVDRKKKQESCLQQIIDIFKESNMIKTLEFTDEDCVRNPIIPKILTLLRDNNI